MQKQIEEIDALLSPFVEKLETLYESLHFHEGVNEEFILTEEIPKGIRDKFDYPGIYFFEIENKDELPFEEWYESFYSIWMDDDYKGKFTPSPVKKRVKEHNRTTNKWIPIYIGKSNHIISRIDGHFNLGLEQTTFALKLCSRKKLFGAKMRLSSIEIRSENYDWIVPLAENFKRKEINPIIGR